MSGNPANNLLVHDVCVVHGWCGGVVDGKPSHVDDFIPDTGPVNANQFVEWLFIADGQDFDADLERWQKQKDALRQLFVKHMGADVVDASKLKWDLS